VSRHPARCRHRQQGVASATLLVLTLLLAMLGVCAWVGMGIITSDRWPIRWLEISGNFQRVSAEQLRANLSTEVGVSFFTADLQSLKDAATRISWVSDVQVQKRWPDTIRITVDEYVPVAHWNRGQLVSDAGEPFMVPEADELQGLPWLEGPGERLEEVLQTWVELDEILLPAGLEISRLRLDGRGAWSMVLDNGTQVQLGRDSTVERLQRLLASWDALLRDQALPPLDVDLRYTNGFAVLWPQPAEQESGNQM